MSSKPVITLIGAGNLASALAMALHAAGYRIDEIVSRPSSRQRAERLARSVRARVVAGSNATLSADIIWFCVNDDAIRDCAFEYAPKTDWKGKIGLHSSGALGSDELRALKRRGAAVASVHPMMTFVTGKAASMKGIAFALEGEARAVQAAQAITRDLGGHPFQIRKENKVLYHAMGAFCSPLVIALLATGEKVARQAKVPPAELQRVIQPILQRTLENYVRQGAAASFSGPINRGDVATVRKHLAALKKLPQARQIYLAVARAAVGALPVRNKAQLERLLQSQK
ncbi:MAG TPA: DUF2520 domain-containing protein [Terriglobales bacterium]|nr:DUF2520 domain-containing protein [Terriglobales bacterium]